MAKKTPIAADVMSTKLAAVAPGAGIRLAAEYMLKRKVSALLVLDAKRRLLGIVSEGDLVHRAELGTRKKGSWWLNLLTTDRAMAREYARAHGRRVADVMTRNVVAAAPGTELTAIAELMDKHKIKRVPIVDEGRVVGVVARADLVAAFVNALPDRPTGRAPDDAAIVSEIRRRVSRQPWIETIMVSVASARGTVSLSGIVASIAQRDALRALAEEVEGVRKVDLRGLVVDRRAIALKHSPVTPMV